MTAANESSTSPPICGVRWASRSATRPSSARSASTRSCERSSGPTGSTSTRTCTTVEARRTYRLRRPSSRPRSGPPNERAPGPAYGPRCHLCPRPSWRRCRRHDAFREAAAAHGLAGPIAREGEVYGGKPASPGTSGPACARLATCRISCFPLRDPHSCNDSHRRCDSRRGSVLGAASSVDWGKMSDLADWSLDDVRSPVDGTLLGHVERALVESRPGPLPDSAQELPNEPARDPKTLGWIAGAYDSLGISGAGSSEEAPHAAAAAVSAVTRAQPDTNVMLALAELVGELNGPRAIDQFMGAIRQDRGLDRNRVAELARWLCCNGTRKGVVKAGLALLGATGTDNDSFLIQRLGLLEGADAVCGGRPSQPPGQT